MKYVPSPPRRPGSSPLSSTTTPANKWPDPACAGATEHDPRILIIAGSDSGGGAGIQADIKTVTMLGGHAMTAVTAITAQNTLGVDAVHMIPTEMVIAQIDAVVGDIGVDAVKIGMIGSAETAEAVADYLSRLAVPVVFDPVMVATSGAVLADPATVAQFDRLSAMADVVTPNLPELDALGGVERLATLAPVLVKGGHTDSDMLVDRLVAADGEIARWTGARIDTSNTHGTGCTLASAIAVGLGEGTTLVHAIGRAHAFVRLALRGAPGFGGGHGPMGQQTVRLDVGRGLRLNQVSLPALDTDATRTFYRLLGLTPIVDSASNGYQRWEAAGGVTLSTYSGGQGVYFEADDLDAEVARLQAAGLAFDELPTERSWGWRQAWLRDPAGNRLCLYHAGENRRYPPWRV